MESVMNAVQLLVSLATLATLTWGLLKMFQSARIAKATREEAIAASKRAELAASAAAGHAETASSDVKAMAENVQKIELATNSMKDALVKSTGKEAFARGKLEGVASKIKETAAKTKPLTRAKR